MINHRPGIFACLFLTWGAFCCNAALGQAVAPDLAREVYEAQNASVPTIRGQIEQFIKGHTANLAGANARAQQLSREALERAVSHPTATSSFHNVYATAANQALSPLADNDNMRVRLNAAIASAQVASRAANAGQADVTLKFMNDNAEPVALWGVKGAQYILPYTIANKQDKVAPAVMAAADIHPNSGPIIEEAYNALGLGFPNLPASATPAVLQASASRVMEMLDSRLPQYQLGLPAAPAADVRAISFLFFVRVWNALSPADQQRAVQQLSDLVSLASQHAALSGPDADLLRVLNQSASAMEVLAGFTKNQALVAVARPLSPERLNDRVPADEIAKRAQAAVDALAAQFKGLRAPPKYDPNAPPPGFVAPGTQPTTRPGMQPPPGGARTRPAVGAARPAGR